MEQGLPAPQADSGAGLADAFAAGPYANKSGRVMHAAGSGATPPCSVTFCMLVQDLADRRV